MKNEIVIKKIIGLDELTRMLKKVVFRGLYNPRGKLVQPYKNAKFSLATVYPSKGVNESPKLVINKKRLELFTPQPTIYQNQIDVLEIADKFLKFHKVNMAQLNKAVKYQWRNRGEFHMLPPVIEKHCYFLKNGYIDLNELSRRFKKKYVKDACGNLHHVAERHLKSFYIDEVSKIDYLDVFNSNAPIINYGLNYNGKYEFYIICDGAHRLDYIIEKLNNPVRVIVVEYNRIDSIPYYAFPVAFRPTIRLSSKLSEKMYHRLERDKIHLFNDFIKKTLHYDWEAGGLKVSKLRSNVEIY